MIKAKPTLEVKTQESPSPLMSFKDPINIRSSMYFLRGLNHVRTHFSLGSFEISIHVSITSRLDTATL